MTATTRGGAGTRASRVRTAAVLVGVCAVWFGLWCLTPGLLAPGLVDLLVPDDGTALLVGSLLVLVLAAMLLRIRRPRTARLLARSRWTAAWVLPAVLLVVLPLHYGGSLPLVLYVLWVGASVLWQDLLTFGLLQDRLGALLPRAAVVPAVAVLFFCGHALLVPERFAPVHVVPSLLILGLGVALALLRAGTRTLHVVLALHLSFYLLVV